MKILVFGATGGTGRQFVEQSLRAGHSVTAFVRNPAVLTILDERLRVVVGDTTRDDPTVAEAVRGQDAVVSALGRGKSLRSEELIERSMRTIVPALETSAVRRFILVSAFGVGDSGKRAPLVPRIMYRLLLRSIFADKALGEEIVRGGSLDWTIVEPVLLTDGPRTGSYRAAERLELHGVPKISRADVAHFLLNEVEAGVFVRKVAVLSS